MKKYLCIFILSILSIPLFSQQKKEVKLPPPDTTGGKPLMQVLNERKSTREFSTKELNLQQISDLLWSAFGVNRPDGRRTAPSAMNEKEIEIYVSLKTGIFYYDANQCSLFEVDSSDKRHVMGKQSFVKDAPITLIYVANYALMDRSGSEEDRKFYAAVDCGYISQNVYLFCASENLATVVLGWIDRVKITEALRLNTNQKVILTQSVGYPK